MIAYNISVGILALPKAFSDLGLVTGILIILPYAFINYFTSMVVWEVTQRYRKSAPRRCAISETLTDRWRAAVYAYPDILALLFGRWGRRVGNVIQIMLQGFLTAVHVMVMRKAIVAMIGPKLHICGVAWTFLGAAVMFLFCLYRNLKECAWIARICEPSRWY